MKKSLIFSGLIILFMVNIVFAAPVGKITLVEGKVDVVKAGKTVATPVNLGDPVDVGDIYRAKSNGRAEITFIDKNVLKIAQNTRTEIQEYTTQKDRNIGIVKLYRGKVQATAQTEFVKKVAAFAEGNKLEIHTPNAVAGVRGTIFAVSYQGGLTWIFCQEGTVYVFNPANPAIVILVPANFVSSVSGETPPTQPAMLQQFQIEQQLVTWAWEKLEEKVRYEEDRRMELDATPPVIQIAQKPPVLTNSPSASFLFTVDETATFSYSLDGGVWTSTGPLLNLSNLSEGTHILEVKAQDPAGNISEIISYSWRTDYTAPLVSIPTKPPSDTNQSTASFGFSATETSTYEYRLDGGDWTSTGASLNLSGLSEGTHTLEVKATDMAGNTSSPVSYSWRTDYTAPLVSIPTKPPSDTNQSTASFGFSADDPSATYSYRLDGGSWTSTGASLNLSGLSEGTHTLEVRATDTVGNTSSIVSYSWRTDYTAPIVSTTPSAKPVGGSTQIDITLSPNETASLSYRFDGGDWIPTSGAVTLSGVQVGPHSFEYQAIDSVGNTSTGALPFDLSRYTLNGSAYHSMMSGEIVEGGIAAIDNQNWGGWKISYDGGYETPPSGNFHMVAGGTNAYYEGEGTGYWLSHMNLNATGNNLSGSADITHLTQFTLGTGTGSVAGSYLSGSWDATAQGPYTSKPLSFVSEIDADLTYYGDGGGYGYLNGLMGGTSSLWTASQGSPASMTALGEYYPDSENHEIWSAEVYSHNYKNELNTTYDGGAFRGYIGGTKNYRTYDLEYLDSRFVGIYVNPSGRAGYVKGSLSGMGYPYPNIGMFEMSGSAYPVQIYDSIGIAPRNLYASLSFSSYELEGSGLFQGGGSINIKWSSKSEISTSNRELAVWNSEIYGTYSGTTSNSWTLSTSTFSEGASNYYSETETTGTQWSSNKLLGSTIGYGADFSTAKTWISVGETLGTFNPATTSWQAIHTGLSLETNQFLTMAGTSEGRTKLQQLNIPCVEIGRTDLSGSYSNPQIMLGISVNMNDVIFFAPNTGQKPQIWATGNVSGNYSGNPQGTTVNLSGGGLSAQFNVQQWNSNKWLSTITNGNASSGIGSYSGAFTFKGAGAGTYTGIESGNFTGTAAGVAK